MDDKEKEKFGVIVDKNNQSEGEQPKIEENTSEEKSDLPKSDEQSSVSTELQPKVDDNKPNEQNIEQKDKNITSSTETQTENQKTTENVDQNQENLNDNNEKEKKEHQVIHKKDGRLHIYVRQDKYKGELKSKNWVGRLYIDGKQKISSSGTQNLDEAIPILEKWFDDVHAEKEKQKDKLENVSLNEQTPNVETSNKINETKVQEVTKQVSQESKPTDQSITSTTQITASEEQEDSKPKSILDKLKGFKIKTPSFGKKDGAKINFKSGGGKVKEKFNNFLKSKLGKKSAEGEEIVGVEITNTEIRLSQISSNKANQWVLDRFYVHKVDLPDDASIIDNATKISEELNIALQKSKITTPNAAIAIPVTNAIIRVVTAPLMNDEELKKAIDTSSLWENLVQLTDNLDDYSIFHQVINRNPKENTMDILFVASKLSDINNYTSIIKNSGLNPVIIDVKCFALKSAVDQINQISNKTEDTNFTALLEFGLDENYVMILYNNNPIITDIFLRGQDRKILKESNDQEEKDALVRRFMTQVKQAVQDFETKYEKRVRNIKVVSNLPNVDDYLSSFRKSLVNTGFNLFDPFDGLKVPQQLEKSIDLQNRSYFSTVVGLAFRKLDVFGYYKFVTAVKNINLLPNREGMIKQKKMKAFSNFAYKGVVGAVVGIYLILFALAFWNINSYNEKLKIYDVVVKEHTVAKKDLAQINKELKVITTTLKLSNSLKSNKDLSYRILAQIASSVPNRVKFDSVNYNGKSQVIITGIAASDQDILQLIRNLQNKSLIKQASLSSMNLPRGKVDGQTMKGFRVFVKIGKS
ncbi:pilus assembly protein PilM [Candidatus Pelagibacter sp.]|nr:pilus assembly protein PilM [Candidatus Pelagibacter sp.]